MVVFVVCMLACLFKDSSALLFSCLASGMLGFADNVLNLEWRWKLIVPFFTLVPLTVWYNENYSFDVNLFGFNIKLHWTLTMVYIILFAIFCQNAVNIYAGINGIEIGQSVVAQVASVCYLVLKYGRAVLDDQKLYFSAALSLIFIGSSMALFRYNKYPAKCFVGDVYTYFAGCVYVTAAVAGDYLVMAVFLYFQELINFFLSLPQLIGIVECPRHRLPKLSKEDGKLYGQTQNWNLINQYLLKIVRGGLTEKQIWTHLITIQVVGSTVILAVWFAFIK